MNLSSRLLALLLALGVALPSSASPISAIPFDASQLGALQPVKYRLEDGPDAGRPVPPNLNPGHAAAVNRAMKEARDRGMPPGLGSRVADVIIKLDRLSGERVTPDEWTRKIDALAKGMAAEFPAGRSFTPEQWEAGVDKLLGELAKRDADPHTEYLSKENMRRMTEHTQNAGFVGIGAVVEKKPDGVGIGRTMPGSPARAAGIQNGDVITHIDRVPTAGMDINEAVTRMRGTPGTQVELRVRRNGQDLPQPVVVTRARVHSPNTFARMVAPGVGLVYFAGFTDKVDEEVFAHIDALKARGMTKLILDMRGNPGGLLSMAHSISSEFLRNDQEIASTRTRGVIQEKALTDGHGKYHDLPVVVLLDAGSASASEVVAAALQDHARAKIVGTRSYGKGTFQAIIPTEIEVETLFGLVRARMPDGAGVKITSGGWHAPTGRNVNGRHDPALGRNVPGSGGIVPDVPVSVSDAERQAVMEGIGEQLFGAPAGAPNDSALAAAIAARP